MDQLAKDHKLRPSNHKGAPNLRYWLYLCIFNHVMCVCILLLINVQTCTAENLLNRNGDSKGPGYAARMLNAGNLTRDPADPLKRPNTAQPYSLHQQKRRLPGILNKY